MNVFKKKEPPIEYVACDRLKESIQLRLSMHSYISRKEYSSLLENETISHYLDLEKEDILKPYCRKKHIPLKKMRELLSFSKQIESSISDHNEKY